MDVLSFSQLHKRLPTPVKENPLKVIAASLAAAGTIIGAILTVDARYAHAADIQKESLSQQKQITKIEADRLEDKVFELDIKKQTQNGKLNALDQALYNRYQMRLMRAKSVSQSK